jgi:hypothetical protein
MMTRLDKYLLGSKDLSFVEKKTGTIYMFRCPNGRLYFVDDDTFTQKMVGPSVPKNIAPSMLCHEDIFTIHNCDFRSMLQFIRPFYGEYYVMKSGDNTFIVNGIDMN